MKKWNKKIGVFDSGFGGISILKGIMSQLPEYDYIYLGDNARSPYGTRSQDLVYKFTEEAVQFLFDKECELVIVACNTASSEALRKLQRGWLRVNYPEKRVLGVIRPAVEEASEVTRLKKIGVMATEGTVASKAFEKELYKLDAELEVVQQACPLLVPIIEAGGVKEEWAREVLYKYLTPILNQGVDTLVLGCTHYGLIEDEIKKIVGEQIKVINEAWIVGEKLKDYLARHKEVEMKLNKDNKREFYTTDLPKKFESLGSEYFGEKIEAKLAIV